MKITRAIGFCLLSALGATVVPASVDAQVSRLGETVALWSDGGARGSDIAFDSKNNVYLAVSSFGTVRGRYLSADGVPLGAAFVIQASGFYSHFPRVAYSPDAAGGAGGFLVTWHASVTGGGTDVFSRMVSYTQGLGTEALLMASDSRWEAGAAVAYSTGSKEFLVVWQTYFADLRGVRVDNTGTPIGSPFYVALTTDGERDPNIAYNAAADEFLVVYSGWSASFAFVRSQRVKAGANIGAPAHVTAATGTYITNVAYNAATGNYLAAWYQPGGHFGRMLGADGTPIADVIVLSTTYAAYDSLGLAYNTTSGTFHTISHGPSADAGGVELTPTGTPLTGGAQITAIGGSIGNFYPRLAANTARAEWATTAAHQFSVTIAQRFGTATRSTAPAPACTFALPATGTSFTSFAGGETITVTASAPTCSWTASSNTGWLTVTSGLPKTGTTTLSYTVAGNASSVKRTGTLTIAGKSYTVTQEGRNLSFDIDGDANADILWHNAATGQVAVWRMKGLTMSAGHLLVPDVAGPGWEVVGTADLNADGHVDLVWQNNTGAVAYWLREGDRLLGSALIASGVPTAWRIVATGDVDGDGKPDFVWQHTDGTVYVWFMDGVQLRYAGHVVSLADARWRIVGATDLDRDGHTDLVWHHAGDASVAVWLMKNQALVSGVLVNVGASDVNWQIVGLADYNADGYMDFLWRHNQTGALYVWFMRGTQVLAAAPLAPAAVADMNWRIAGPQ